MGFIPCDNGASCPHGKRFPKNEALKKVQQLMDDIVNEVQYYLNN